MCAAVGPGRAHRVRSRSPAAVRIAAPSCFPQEDTYKQIIARQHREITNARVLCHDLHGDPHAAEHD